jgi:hypothetical protein
MNPLKIHDRRHDPWTHPPRHCHRLILVLLPLLVLIPAMIAAAPSSGTFVGMGPNSTVDGTLADGTSYSNQGGTMKFDAGLRDGIDVLPGFCADINHPVRSGDTYNIGEEVTDWRLLYLLADYPPHLSGDDTEMAARQAAVWYVTDGFQPDTDPGSAVGVRAWEIIDGLDGMTQADYDAIKLPHLSLAPAYIYTAVPKYSQTYEVTLYQGEEPVTGGDVVIATDNGKLDDLHGTTSTSGLTLTTSVTGFATFKLLPPPGRTRVTATLTATAEGMTAPAGFYYIHEDGPEGQELVLGEDVVEDVSAGAQISWEDPNALVLTGLVSRSNRVIGWGGLGVAVILGVMVMGCRFRRRVARR